ncbi:MAG TPA: putative porin [Steroidobacteraceae bacterium]|nr:putative porin [Steroidobacteraceae bacterium]
MSKNFGPAVVLLLALPLASPGFAAESPSPPQSAPPAQSQSAQDQSFEVLRNTVVDLLQALVQRGIITREQADAMVRDAQAKAEEQARMAAAQKAQQEKEEANAIRVPYVPEIVKDEIKQEVAKQVTPEVTKQVIADAKQQGWGVPGALPDWIERIKFSGDVRLRGEADLYSRNNAQNYYLNYTAINAAGGINQAGDAAYLDTTVNRYYPLVRLRFDMNATMSGGWFVGARFGTGTLINPDSLNQVEGQYGGRYTTDIDLAYLGWSGSDSQQRQQLTFWGGKYPNPFFYSDLVWMPDVTFEGLSTDYRVRMWGPASAPRSWFLTVGAIPEEYAPLTYDFGPESTNKWLYAGQTGFDFKWESGNRVRLGIAYYDFNHMAGQLNSLYGTTTNYTAPPYFQKGNTVFDIANTQGATDTFALAAEYHELDAMLATDWMVTPAHRLSWFADFVKNLGYDEAAVAERVAPGTDVRPRVEGYESQLSFGTPDLTHSLAWDLFVGYRYLQRDAVVDAFTDQDYHLGGTNDKGYILGGDLGITDRVYTRLRYMPFEVIDGPPLTIDVWQLEVVGRF